MRTFALSNFLTFQVFPGCSVGGRFALQGAKALLRRHILSFLTLAREAYPRGRRPPATTEAGKRAVVLLMNFLPFL